MTHAFFQGGFLISSQGRVFGDPLGPAGGAGICGRWGGASLLHPGKPFGTMFHCDASPSPGDPGHFAGFWSKDEEFCGRHFSKRNPAGKSVLVYRFWVTAFYHVVSICFRLLFPEHFLGDYRGAQGRHTWEKKGSHGPWPTDAHGPWRSPHESPDGDACALDYFWRFAVGGWGPALGSWHRVKPVSSISWAPVLSARGEKSADAGGQGKTGKQPAAKLPCLMVVFRAQPPLSGGEPWAWPCFTIKQNLICRKKDRKMGT